MDGKLNIFDAIGLRLDWLSQRQRVLADNIANSDTPDFVPRDLDATRFQRILRQEVASVEPEVTHAAHLGGAAPAEAPARSQSQRLTYETSPSGNAVVLEEQMIRVAETQNAYQLMTNLYRKHMELFRIALRGGPG